MIHPRARALGTILGVAGALVGNRPVVMAAGWFVVLVMICLSNLAKQHCRFLAAVLLPIGVALLLIWGVLVGAPPGAPIGKDHMGGVLFAVTVILRLALLGGIVQLSLLSIPAAELPKVLASWGLTGDSLVMTLGALVLLPELQLRSGQVLTARLARGMAPDRSMVSRLGQLPFLLRPLLGWALRSAVQRSESWHQKRLLSQFASVRDSETSSVQQGGVGYVILGGCWLAASIVSRFTC